MLWGKAGSRLCGCWACLPRGWIPHSERGGGGCRRLQAELPPQSPSEERRWEPWAGRRRLPRQWGPFPQTQLCHRLCVACSLPVTRAASPTFAGRRGLGASGVPSSWFAPLSLPVSQPSLRERISCVKSLLFQMLEWFLFSSWHLT